MAGGAFLILVALVPLAGLGLATLMDTGRPVLIRQRRIGVDGREFLMWKLRTLPVDTPQVAKGALDRALVRPTRLGAFLRRFSLDEIPQLINVVSGEMSLVGPRPALFTQDDLVRLRKAAGVLWLRPGLTGLAQVSGREALTLQDKVDLDARYARELSLWLDLSIVLRTLLVVFRSRGTF